MTGPSDEIIARLEQATEGSQELDAEIDASLRIGKTNLPEWAWANFPKWRARPDGRVEVAHDDGRGGLSWQPHPYTTSIDAALSLVPEGWEWCLSSTGTACICTCWADDSASVFKSTDVKQPRQTPFNEWQPKAPTPALALCIAALKARKASTP